MTRRTPLLTSRLFVATTFGLFAGLASCTNEDPEESALDAQAVYLDQELSAFVAAVTAIQSAAPAPDADGWNATADAAAVAEMKVQWAKARDAYEHVESSVAAFFGDLDVSVDQRYDAFVEEVEGGDPYLFDAQNVRGMHAVERILWADQIPSYVVAFEEKLVGYKPAAFPATQQEATDFRDALCAKLIADATELREQYATFSRRLEPKDLYHGVFDSMAEQLEKVDLTATGEAESRYANRTLADMKANLAGGKVLYQAFSGWVQEQDNGKNLDAAVMAGFARIEALYQLYPMDTMPPVPEGWNPDMPMPAHLQTDYGKLWLALTQETDLTVSTSLLSSIVAAGAALDFDLGVVPAQAARLE